MKKKVLISILIICISIVGILTFKNIQMNKQIKEQNERIENQQKLEEQKKLDEKKKIEEEKKLEEQKKAEKEKNAEQNKLSEKESVQDKFLRDFDAKLGFPIGCKIPTLTNKGVDYNKSSWNGVPLRLYEISVAAADVLFDTLDSYDKNLNNSSYVEKFDKKECINRLNKLKNILNETSKFLVEYESINDKYNINEKFIIDEKEIDLNLYLKISNELIKEEILSIDKDISRIESNKFKIDKTSNGDRKLQEWISNHSLNYEERKLVEPAGVRGKLSDYIKMDL